MKFNYWPSFLRSAFRSAWFPKEISAVQAQDLQILYHEQDKHSQMAQIYEQKLLNLNPNTPISTIPVVLSKRSSRVTINTVRIPGKNKVNGKAPLVLAHGFGSGLGLWFRNFEELSHSFPEVIAFDWMGMGRSSRLKFEKMKLLCRSSREGHTQNSLNFFVDSLEEWREAMGIEKMVLAGHSLGGYLSAEYALKYPDRVSKLVLASPVGLQTPVHDPNRKIPFFAKVIKSMWHANLTPQTLLRASGNYGEKLVQNSVRRRFAVAGFSEVELDLIAHYMYHISVAAASGEYALNSLLIPALTARNPGVYARMPLDSRLHQLNMPTQILFGDKDWMLASVTGLHDLVAKIPKGKMYIVAHSGHHLYLDNPTMFHQILAEEME